MFFGISRSGVNDFSFVIPSIRYPYLLPKSSLTKLCKAEHKRSSQWFLKILMLGWKINTTQVSLLAFLLTNVLTIWSIYSGKNPFDGFTPSVPSGTKLDYGSEEYQSLENEGELFLPQYTCDTYFQKNIWKPMTTYSQVSKKFSSQSSMHRTSEISLRMKFALNCICPKTAWSGIYHISNFPDKFFLFQSCFEAQTGIFIKTDSQTIWLQILARGGIAF